MDEAERVALGARIKSARVRKFATVTAATAASGVNAATWGRTERGDKVRDDRLSEVVRALWPETGGDWTRIPDHDASSQPTLPPGVKPIGNPDDELVEFRVSGAFGVQAVVRGPIRDIDALQAAVSKLIAGMRVEDVAENGV